MTFFNATIQKLKEEYRKPEHASEVCNGQFKVKMEGILSDPYYEFIMKFFKNTDRSFWLNSICGVHFEGLKRTNRKLVLQLFRHGTQVESRIFLASYRDNKSNAIPLNSLWKSFMAPGAPALEIEVEADKLDEARPKVNIKMNVLYCID